MEGIAGYIYPNEHYVPWSVLIVLYPHLTSMMAGSFIVAALSVVGGVKAFAPVRRTALLATLAFAAAAPLPLLIHLHHPDRALSILVTPNLSSAMAVFGFALAWFVMGIVIWLVWLEFRTDIVRWSQSATGLKRTVYRLLTLGVTDTSAAAVDVDTRLGRVLYAIGIPSALLLPGYVGFIFGSIKANAWWQSPLIPIVFVCLAFVSGFEIVMLLYVIANKVRGKHGDPAAEHRLGAYLLLAIAVGFVVTGLDTIHHFYLGEEHFGIVDAMVHDRLWFSMITLQIMIGVQVPAVLLIVLFFYRLKSLEWLVHILIAVLVQVGVFAVRWNVVMGGQAFSRSLRGYRPENFEWGGKEGGLMAIAVLLTPFVILTVLAWLLPPWNGDKPSGVPGPKRRQAPAWVTPVLILLPAIPIAWGLNVEGKSQMLLQEVPADVEVDSTLPGTFRPSDRQNTLEREIPLEVEAPPAPEPEVAAVPAVAEGSGSGEGSGLGAPAEGSL